MDALKKELEKKRKAFQADFGNRRFVARGEIERKKIEQLRQEEEKERERKRAKQQTADAGAKGSGATGGKSGGASASKTVAVTAGTSGTGIDKETEDRIDSLVLPRAEVIKRLRVLRHPITLFGEDDEARLARLKHVMKTGEVDPDGELLEGQQNDFLRDMAELKKGGGGGGARAKKDSRKGDAEKKDGGKGEDGGRDGGGGDGGGAEDEGQSEEEDDVDSARMRANFEDLCEEDKILVFFKKLLREWQQELDAKPEAERRTVKGKSAVATFKQCARYIDPLFIMCRRKQLYEDIQAALLYMVGKCRERDYLAAMDKYIKLSIGNAPWPIGVTMVGIHERSAREKIHASSVAHIMNDETTRKYLQSVKRLMTLCQRRYPALPSKAVEFNSLANGSDLEALLQDEERKAAAAGGGGGEGRKGRLGKGSSCG
ncbi:hypothetical protein CLOM_g20695 [Closterium sp. NIES-68]|nr:hypothetical protein CLOM_g20695 [Closterium sp. NIES-68]